MTDGQITPATSSQAVASKPCISTPTPLEEYPSKGAEYTLSELLTIAYKEEYGKTGHALAGNRAIDEEDVNIAFEKGGSSLLYGELLPTGVQMLQEAFYFGRDELDTSGPLLELGMGTGKVALQMLLSTGRNVYGVELARNRWKLADAAARRLAEALPARFEHKQFEEDSVQLVDKSRGSTCDIVCGSLLETPTELLRQAAVVVMEVCLPKEVQCKACEMLQHCRAGCRVVCYAPVHGTVDGCRLAPVRFGCTLANGIQTPNAVLGDGRGGLCLPASWNAQGHGFAFYELSATAEQAAKAWQDAAKDSTTGFVNVDETGNPSRGKRFRRNEEVLGSPRAKYRWAKGDRVLVGYSWLPFIDLGTPGDEGDDPSGLDGVSWVRARVLNVDAEGFATICIQDDGTVEEKVHPERIRKEGDNEPREKPVIDWGDY